MASSTTGEVAEAPDDTRVRNRIGPWVEDGDPDLSEFNPDRNFVVRAAAGSGKTTALVARMVALVRQGVPAEDLTAITFTRKAAGEMNARFFEELRKAREALPDGSDQHERVSQALRNVQSAFIGTIHAFSSRLLRGRPLAAGLPPDFSAGLEDREARELRERAWHRHLQEVHEEHPEAIERIAACGIDPQDLTSFFETLCRYPELDPYVNPPEEPPDLGPAVEAARERLREWNARRPEQLPKGKDPVMKAFDKARRMLRYRDLGSAAEKAEFLEVFAGVSDEEKAKVKVTYWRGEDVDNKDWAGTLRDELLPRFVETEIRPVLRRWEAHVHRLVVSFTRPAVETYRSLRQEEGLLRFHDLLLHTRNLLRDHPGIRREIQERYPILLVDEFQDTDPLQAEILSFLTSQDPRETDWRECSPRDGSLFIVGDDKQSIYRFRRADKSVFDTFRERIDAEPNGEAVDLTKNFRSRRPICEWCNDAFEAIFEDPTHRDIQADYVPFNPQEPDGPGGTALRKIPLEKEYRNLGDKIARQDARRIAEFIRAAQTGNADSRFHLDEDGAVFESEASYSDFLILTRTKNRLGIYAEVLAQRGIPYVVTGSEDLGDSDELKALADLLAAALRPDDPIATIAYLKGPLAGFNDGNLYKYRQAGGNFDQTEEPIPEAVKGGLDSEITARFEGAFERLREVRSTLLEKRPAVGIEKIAEDLGFLAGASHPDEPSEASLRAGTLLRIVSYVQHLSVEGLGWGEISEELELILDGEETVDGMTLETGSEDAVRLMNVHQAKGLEAPVVFLADPYTSGNPPSTTVHLRREEGELVAPVVQGEGYYRRVTHAPLGWHEDTEKAFKQEEKRRDEAEDRRLLYVAATRAERLLVVSTYPEKPDDGYWSPLYEHLQEAGVSDLTVPEEEVAPVGEAPAPDLEESRAERQRRLVIQGQQQVQIRSVTDEKSGHPSLSRGEGYGSDFGIAVHELFETLVHHRGGPPEFSRQEIRAFLQGKGAGGTDREVRHAQDMLDGFRESWIWEDLQSASVVRAEQPFARHWKENRADGKGSEEILRGTIDLVYQTGGAWTIVDFKTDRIDRGDSGFDLFSAVGTGHDYYRQVQAYVEAWRNLTGGPIDRAGLWFADTCQFLPMKETGERSKPTSGA